MLYHDLGRLYPHMQPLWTSQTISCDVVYASSRIWVGCFLFSLSLFIPRRMVCAHACPAIMYELSVLALLLSTPETENEHCMGL